MNLTYDRNEAGKLFKISAPILFGSLASTGMAFTDTVMAGRVGASELAGLSLAVSIYILIIIPLSALMMAVTPIIAADHGAEKPDQIKFHFYQLLYAAVIVTVIAVTATLSSAEIFSHLDIEKRVEEVAGSYALIITLGLPFLFAFNSFRSLTEGLSNTVVTMICCIIGLIFNIGLNYIFIYGKLGMPAMGAAGCAVATVTVQILMFLIQLLLIKRIKYLEKCRIFSSPPKISMEVLNRYVRISLPLGLAIFFEIGIFSFFAFVITVMGTKAIAANQIFFNYMSVLYMIPMSLSSAVSIRVGYTIGAKDRRRTEVTITTCLIIGLVTSMLVGAASYILKEEIAGMYTEDTEVIEILKNAFICVSVYQLGDYCQTICTGVLRGLQETKIITVMAVIAYWLFAVPAGLALCFTNFMWGPHEFFGLCTALSVSLYILAVAYLLKIALVFK
jgi:MATE family multidrug resistance protein